MMKQTDSIDLFNKFHSSRKIQERVKNYISSFEKLEKLTDKMITPNIAENNMSKVEAKDIKSIIHKE